MNSAIKTMGKNKDSHLLRGESASRSEQTERREPSNHQQRPLVPQNSEQQSPSHAHGAFMKRQALSGEMELAGGSGRQRVVSQAHSSVDSTAHCASDWPCQQSPAHCLGFAALAEVTQQCGDG